MVEEYQQALSLSSLGGIRDLQSLYPQLGLKSSPQVTTVPFARLQNRSGYNGCKLIQGKGFLSMFISLGWLF